MDMLKKFFPYSFGAKDTTALVIKIVVYVVAMVVGGLLLSLIGLISGWIPLLGAVIGWILGVIGTVIEVYCVIGIVLSVLDYFKVLK